ncbi:helix-turn-helix domain-containing protein [Streptomyces sp. NPDC021020]|uniref:helix-turn-helix domain-containing protein n=1 Tax=Streptomyces sp. NPDC021020 TaxID=3365109 RepID=UPI00379C7DF0
MPAGGRPTVRSRRLGAALREYRLAAKLEQLQVAEVIAASQTRVSRIETGHVTARPIEIRAMLDAFGVADLDIRKKLEDMSRASYRRGWWLEHSAYLRPDYLDHISLEDDATYIREWQPVVVPGLLQTPAYAEAVITASPSFVAPERVEHLIRVRQTRQAKIAPGAANYTAIVWEPVVVHPLVDPKAHIEQLQHILTVTERQNVTVQVMPFAAGALAGAASAFSSFSFDDEPIVEAVTMDNVRGTSVLEAPADLAAYTNVFDKLRSAALSPDDSVRLIQSALREGKKGTQWTTLKAVSANPPTPEPKTTA